MFRGKIMFAWGILMFFLVLELTSTQKTKPSVRFLASLPSQWLGQQSHDQLRNREIDVLSAQRQRILFSGRKIWAASQIEHLKNISLIRKFFIRNPPQSSPFFSILVPFWLIVSSFVFFYLRQLLFGASFLRSESNFNLVFFYLSKLLFCGFLQFEGDFALHKKWLKISWHSSFKISWHRSFNEMSPFWT